MSNKPDKLVKPVDELLSDKIYVIIFYKIFCVSPIGYFVCTIQLINSWNALYNRL